jgi:hypothetical protein
MCRKKLESDEIHMDKLGSWNNKKSTTIACVQGCGVSKCHSPIIKTSNLIFIFSFFVRNVKVK